MRWEGHEELWTRAIVELGAILIADCDRSQTPIVEWCHKLWNAEMKSWVGNKISKGKLMQSVELLYEKGAGHVMKTRGMTEF